MDGPAVNLAFMESFLNDFEYKFNKSLLETGVCSLHVVSGALKYGHKIAEWRVEAFLKALYEVWKRSPARRDEYTSITSSTVFPKKFCSTRWTENKAACQRAIEILPNVKKFCKEVKPKPTIQSFDTVQMTVRDTFCEARLHFFSTIADDFEPFLRRFQSEKPMFPFLYSFLLSLLNGVLRRFVKTEVLEDVGTNLGKLKSLDLNNCENLIMVTHIDIGFGAKRAVSPKAKPSEKLDFYKQCQAFLRGVANKLLERSPIKHSLIRGASALSPPTIIQNTQSDCVDRFKVVIDSFLDKKQISVSEGESAKREYIEFISCSSNRTRLENFNLDEDRLDDLYVQIIGKKSGLENLWIVVRKLLILFHGQAAVESGFSINKDLLMENMHEKSVIGLRIVYDVVNAFGVLGIPITNEMIDSVRFSSQRRKLHLLEKRQKENEVKEARKRKNEVDAELKSIENESVRLQEQIKELNDRASVLKAAKLQL